MAQALFDSAAISYDQEFSHTFVGREQRKRVYDWLEKKKILASSPLSILELNCGTGMDAIYFTQKGHRVVATDISNAMLEQARIKANKNLLQVDFQVLDIKNLHQMEDRYDLIFSNFGGLNCIEPSDWKKLFSESQRLMQKNGKLIGVLMSKKCWIENLYFLFRADFSKIGRRNRNKECLVHVNGSLVPTWYYSPSEVAQMANPYFNVRWHKPIGIGIPPSYLSNRVEKNRILKSMAILLEKLLGSSSLFSNFADHYIICLEKK
ncbi:MAG: class I SAM-dependent methyltransferase [Cytophagaceae bacterium]|jgi:ubiquinone/menaquinone biosynthesis C-methylase UbiE|nr:class I SAM-dependent methyltransferase [Cytophagaceae bacterium]